MKTFVESLEVNASVQQAWKALLKMDLWLPKLSTNRSISWQRDQHPFCVQGRQYQCTTKEDVVMTCQIVEVNEALREIRIRAEHRPLVSLLTCQIESIDAQRCRLIRRQSYPGLVGWLFTKLYQKREANETGEYLKVWARFIQ